jgi:hypothetical protein
MMVLSSGTLFQMKLIRESKSLSCFQKKIAAHSCGERKGRGWMEIMGRGKGDCCGQEEMEESC